MVSSKMRTIMAGLVFPWQRLRQRHNAFLLARREQPQTDESFLGTTYESQIEPYQSVQLLIRRVIAEQCGLDPTLSGQR
jgi:hypothetical protein